MDHEVEPSTHCRISGWGAISWQGFMPNELRKANVSIVERSFCNSTDSYGKTFVDGMVCASGVNEDGVIDVCQGGEVPFLIVNLRFQYLFANEHL